MFLVQYLEGKLIHKAQKHMEANKIWGKTNNNRRAKRLETQIQIKERRLSIKKKGKRQKENNEPGVCWLVGYQ